VLQQALVADGRVAAFSFVLTVFLAHKILSLAIRRFTWLRKLIRSTPRPLVLNGQIDHRALREETGHLSAVPFQSTEKHS
jgi:uncharacterized membrane protein YcaP (DUF421 family)